jgi:beta-galactosidase
MVHLGIISGDLPGDRLINWHRDVIRDWSGQEGQVRFVACCSNCPQVELWLNGKSYGVKQSVDFIGGTALWEIPYTAGMLKAAGMKNGVNLLCG